ncbi:hypothetical protein FB566_5080 [Stackebrandtia endophytica]|uniref:Uncharacterized protein n=1 Tax=Stackebrandtia endophytica TaxID=1496996 RepID=A0A543B3U2_9ACTN|nr:hypothetical protein FB566_5080 [Stackebrandtia endophytica]
MKMSLASLNGRVVDGVLLPLRSSAQLIRIQALRGKGTDS